jgi:hypothetical protein
MLEGLAITEAVSRRLRTTIPVHVMLNLWWTKWQCGKISASTSVSLPVVFPPTYPYSSIIQGWCSRPTSGQRTKRTQVSPHPRIKKKLMLFRRPPELSRAPTARVSGFKTACWLLWTLCYASDCTWYHFLRPTDGVCCAVASLVCIAEKVDWSVGIWPSRHILLLSQSFEMTVERIPSTDRDNFFPGSLIPFKVIFPSYSTQYGVWSQSHIVIT